MINFQMKNNNKVIIIPKHTKTIPHKSQMYYIFRIVSLGGHLSSISNLNLKTTDILLIDVAIHEKEIERTTNICTNTLLTKCNKSTYVSLNPHFCNWSCGLRRYLELLASTTQSVFLPSSAST